MFLILKDNNTYIKQSLTNNFKYKGITIFKDNVYKIKLEDNYSFSNIDKNEIEVELISYEIVIEDRFDTISLLFYDNDIGINDYQLYENKDFILSESNNSLITNLDLHIKDDLQLSNGRLFTNSNLLLVNKNKYKGKYLKDGDFVEYLGFCFYYYKDFLYINNFYVINRLNNHIISKTNKHKVIKPPLLNNYYEKPKSVLKVERLEIFNEPKKGNNRKIILQIGPTITMSIAMIMMASINVYNTYQNNGNKLSIISLLLMPITMLISGIMWPVLASTSENRLFKKEYKKAKDEYLEYLNNYDNDLIKNIQLFINDEKSYFFNTKDIENNKIFYINKNSNEFLKISLGTQSIKMPIECKLCKDNEINEFISRIKYRLDNIENYPLYLDIKENKIITVISYTNNAIYLFKRFLLELIYKYNYEDCNIAIYSKNKTIYKEIFNIPHLMVNNKRLTLDNERQLHDLNNLKIEKPLIVLSLDYTDFHFTNDNIHIIYFSNIPNVILKNSNCIIEFRNNTGDYNGNNQIKFKHYEEDIDFNNYFNKISLFSYSTYNNSLISFKDFNWNSITENYLSNYNGVRADFALINGELLSFDLHETKDGPHGLIGGSTGSGKSELIVSLLLSLAIRYSPLYLNVILIDYKGGGIKDSLSYNSLSLPHIIASITNLEADTFERLIVSISRECKKRQELFKKLSYKSSTSITNLDDYLEINKNYKFENIAHLLIIVDEFAELKKESPGIIKELISFSRIGRSLGIHLILATQKPSGVIDDEIWSNSHFKIALKVHSEKDSQDIIKSKQAAYLSKPGEFYLQEDGNMIKAKALYSKRDINNNDQFEVDLLDNTLEVIKKKIYKKTNPFFESTYYTCKIIEACNTLKIKTKPLDYLKPNRLKRNELIKKYKTKNELVLGEIDDYLNAKKDILEYNIKDNILIYSTRNKEINGIINSLKDNKIRTIIISNIKYKSEYVSDSLLYGDEDDIKYLFKKLLNDTKTKLSILIEDLNTLLSYNEEYINNIYQLIRRSSISNYSFIILSKQSNINFRLLNSIQNRIAISIYENQDLINMFSSKSIYQGKSFYFDEIVKPFIECEIEETTDETSIIKPYIDKLPEIIKYEYLNDHLFLGYDLLTRKQIYISDNDCLLISSYDLDLIKKYEQLFSKNTNVNVILYSKDILSKNYKNVIWLGDGLYSQRIFYVDKEITINDLDAYYYSMNKGRVIRVVNYE